MTTTDKAIEIINSCTNPQHTSIAIPFAGLLINSVELSKSEQDRIWKALQDKVNQFKEETNAARNG
jgi:hypothetical protein